MITNTKNIIIDTENDGNILRLTFCGYTEVNHVNHFISIIVLIMPYNPPLNIIKTDKYLVFISNNTTTRKYVCCDNTSISVAHIHNLIAMILYNNYTSR